MTRDVNVMLLDFPSKGSEMVTENEDGSYTIIINSKLSYERQMEAYKHAIKHIENDDFSKYDIQEIEYQVRNDSKEDLIPANIYLEELKRLQTEHKALKRKIKQDEERIRFLQQSFSLYCMAENRYLYADNL